MTSVPKPLKYLRPLYPDMVAIHDSWAESADRVGLLEECASCTADPTE